MDIKQTGAAAVLPIVSAFLKSGRVAWVCMRREVQAVLDRLAQWAGDIDTGFPLTD
ncbi:hypothetical protein [Kitasatospora sp. KL5]|uniref:hypothetical protein n=1 Tax=Kitasatospora sp. KL5 TaxID=3425125 RepID=UPI003D6DC28D